MTVGAAVRGRLALSGLWAVTIAVIVFEATVSLAVRLEEVQVAGRPKPQTFHWVLPAQHAGVEVVELHSGDCYVIPQVEGLVDFAGPGPGVLELQQQLGSPIAHLVESPDVHPECLRTGCVDVARLTVELIARLREIGNSRARRSARHRPSPLDRMRGGAYSDVGSADRSRYRQTPEQRMAYLHLQTAARDNCYEAQAPRMLTIHVRDQQPRPDRTGVYSGYLYLEHHHDPLPGRVAASEPRLLLPEQITLLSNSDPGEEPESGAWIEDRSRGLFGTDHTDLTKH